MFQTVFKMFKNVFIKRVKKVKKKFLKSLKKSVKQNFFQ